MRRRTWRKRAVLRDTVAIKYCDSTFPTQAWSVVLAQKSAASGKWIHGYPLTPYQQWPLLSERIARLEEALREIAEDSPQSRRLAWCKARARREVDDG
jgi:hypothetical protein